MQNRDDQPTRRASDSAPLSITDAMGIFALRSEVAAQGTLVAQTISQTVPRAEHELRWQLSEQRLDRIESDMRDDREKTQAKLEKLDTKMDSLRDEVRGARLPRWAFWLLGILAGVIGPILYFIVTHALKGVLP